MRRTAAALRYLASLSPVAVPKGIPDWPEPVNSNRVREDDKSVASRKSASTEFETLARESEHSNEDLACLQAWRVACLVDDAESRSEAAEIARGALSSDPSNYRVLTWILGRQLDVSIDATVAILDQRLKVGTANLEEIISLIAVRASLENEATDAHPEARWQRFAFLAQLGRWEEISPVASELVDSLQTSDAVRIACHALYNTGDFTGCLAMLDRAPAFYPRGLVSPDLRRLRILAQLRVSGALSPACSSPFLDSSMPAA
jgi:hypothetical protein